MTAYTRTHDGHTLTVHAPQAWHWWWLFAAALITTGGGHA